ncbi:MAG: hypothetical protein HWE22_00315 [Flavobacteriales bacterium]|nr:hypothetical protein [Flavobacteriales bacterium]
MNIKEKILEVRTNRDKSANVGYFANRPDAFDELMQCIFNLEEYPYKEYASWLLIHISRSKKIDLQPYYTRMVDVLFETTDQTVLRNVSRSLTEMEITDYRESEFIDLLIGFIQNYENKVALQVYSIYLLQQFVKRYPELKEETIEIIALHRSGKTVSYKVAERNFLKFVSKL